MGAERRTVSTAAGTSSAEEGEATEQTSRVSAARERKLVVEAIFSLMRCAMVMSFPLDLRSR